MPPGENKVDIYLADAKSLGIFNSKDLELPASSSLGFVLLDEDSQECRAIENDELELIFLENGIKDILPLHPNPWTLSPEEIEKQALKIIYHDGRSIGVKISLIDLNPKMLTRRFVKTKGVAFPVDQEGKILLDSANTPFMADLKENIFKQLMQRAEDRLEVAQLVSIFSDILSNYSNVKP